MRTGRPSLPSVAFDVHRRTVCRSAAVASIAAMRSARLHAQTGGGARVGFLVVGDRASNREWLADFEASLNRLGRTVGRNVYIEYRFGEGDPARLGTAARELVGLGPDIFVAVGVSGATALRGLTGTKPIVGISLADPIGAGLASSLARPGGNVTGVAANIDFGILGKRLQMLQAFVPKARRVAVLRVPGEYTLRFWQELSDSAATLGIELMAVDAMAGGFSAAFDQTLALRPDALFLLGGGILVQHMQAICDFALRARLPATYAFRRFAEAGLLFSYGIDASEGFRRAAVYVDRLLAGASAADLPIEQLGRYALTINRRTADRLGVRIPRNLMLQADEVIG